jgi:hypothetical protein
LPLDDLFQCLGAWIVGANGSDFGCDDANTDNDVFVMETSVMETSVPSDDGNVDVVMVDSGSSDSSPVADATVDVNVSDGLSVTDSSDASNEVDSGLPVDVVADAGSVVDSFVVEAGNDSGNDVPDTSVEDVQNIISMRPANIEYHFNGNTRESMTGTFPIAYGNVEYSADRHGNQNSSLHFNGNMYLVHSSALLSDRLPWGRNSRTLSFWAKSAPMATDTFIVNWGGTGDGRLFGVQDTAFELQFTANSSGNVVQTNFPLRDGRWHHIVVTYSVISPSGVVSIWADGNQVISRSFDTLFATMVATNLVIGTATLNVGNATNWSGDLDDLRIYDGTLNTNELSILFNE